MVNTPVVAGRMTAGRFAKRSVELKERRAQGLKRAAAFALLALAVTAGAVIGLQRVDSTVLALAAFVVLGSGVSAVFFFLEARSNHAALTMLRHRGWRRAGADRSREE